jgi:hypothetical protein
MEEANKIMMKKTGERLVSGLTSIRETSCPSEHPEAYQRQADFCLFCCTILLYKNGVFG